MRNLPALFRPALFRPALGAAALALLFCPPAEADGAFAGGDAFGDFQIECSTCMHIPIPLSGTPSQVAGGTGLAFAAVSYAGTGQRSAELVPDYSLGGGAGFAAQASFEGSSGTPLLRAQANADNEWAYLIPLSTETPVGIDLYQASASANTVRRYVYVGASATTYTFNFQVDGTLTNQLSSVFASAAIYDGSDPLYFETGLVDFGYASLSGTGFASPPTAFAQSFEASITVNPGDSFYLLGHLGVLASMDYEPADVAVDAFNTMRVTSISGGDPQLLLAGPVPEPGTALLLGLGALLLLLRVRGSGRCRADV